MSNPLTPSEYKGLLEDLRSSIDLNTACALRSLSSAEFKLWLLDHPTERAEVAKAEAEAKAEILRTLGALASSGDKDAIKQLIALNGLSATAQQTKKIVEDILAAIEKALDKQTYLKVLDAIEEFG